MIDNLLSLTALCEVLSDPTNGAVSVTGDGNSVDDVATYTCNNGFELDGNDMATCTLIDSNNAAFSPAPPTCLRKSVASLVYRSLLESESLISKYCCWLGNAIVA